ncbi:MAG TPA: S41 family peptidase [Steroidobacteraceae bacterium]|nr:S41 family peptidase [Steroidobacteraceae bacterium]
MSPRARLTLALLVGLLLGLSLSVTSRVVADRSPADGRPPPGGTAALPWKDARLLAEVMQRVHDNYVDPIEDHQLMQNAIRGMVEALDDHSTFLSPDEFEDMKVSTSGTYAGIGVEVVPGKGGVSVVGRMPGSPAERAGIRTGDVIVRIDGVAVDPANLESAIARMRGPEGSPIRLAVRRDGDAALLEFQVERAHVQLQSVAAELLTPDYGYLRITSFTDTTAAELEQAVARLEHSRTRKLEGFVIDLRNDPGGVLDAAVQIADDFLERGTIVSAEGRAADAQFRIEAKPGDITNGARLVVLVNGGSASASEILAAALHDNHRATLIGRRTYGKGSVQTIMPLTDGQALKITTSRYFTPAGISINGVGINPDVALEGPEQPPADMDSTDNLLGAAAAAGAPTLAARDPQVSLALQALSSHTGVVAAGASAVTAR